LTIELIFQCLSFEWCLSFRSGDDVKLLAVRLLRGYIELLGSHVRTVLRSDVHLHRLSSALVHVLQFDCSLVHIIEDRTAGYNRGLNNVNYCKDHRCPDSSDEW